MAEIAYDLDLFENHGTQRTPRIRAVKGKKPARKERMRRFRLLAMCALMVTLVCSLITSQVRLTELTGEIQATNRQIISEESEHNYLSGVLDSKTSQRNVEEIATTQLGLMKLDKSQITYFSLENEETIRRPESTVKKIAEFLTTGVLSLADYLNP